MDHGECECENYDSLFYFLLRFFEYPMKTITVSYLGTFKRLQHFKGYFWFIIHAASAYHLVC